MNLSRILLVTDCDGTLLRDDKTISQKDLDAIARFRELGGNFTIATGRSLPTVSSILELLKPDLPVILYNGSMLYAPVKKTPVWTAEIPQSARFLVEKSMERYGPELGVEVLTPEGLHVIQFTPVIDEHLNGPLKAPYRLASLPEVTSLQWLKVMFALPAEEMEGLKAFLDSFGDLGARYVRSEKLYFEILPAHASKGAALKMLCEKTGLSLKYTAAIGDCDNDLEMLREASLGFVTANAYPSVKEKVGRVTVSNEEGAVSAVIREILEKGEALFLAEPRLQ